MAATSIAFPPDAKRDAAAREIVMGAGQWLRMRLRFETGSWKAGTKFYGVPSSTSGAIYYTNLRYCSCPDYARRGMGCKHQRAVAEHVRAVRDAKHQQQAGSATVADPSPTRRRTYADFYPSCDAGDCTDDREAGERYCYRHRLTDAF